MNFPQHLTIALPNVSPTDSLALLRILAVVGLKVRGAKVKPLFPVINDNYAEAVKVIEGLGLDDKIFRTLCAQLKDRGATMENVAVFLPEFRKAINSNRFTNDTQSITAAAAGMLPPLLTVLGKPDSDNSFNTVQKNIGLLKHAGLTQAYAEFTAEKLGDTDDLEESIKALGKKLTGKPTMTLTTEERAKAKAKNPEGLKEFNKLLTNLRIRVGAEIRNVVAELGEKEATLKAVSEELATRGVPNPFHPGLRKTSRVLVNQDGKMTDKFGSVLTLQNIAPQYEAVINKNYDPDPTKKGNSWLLKAVDPETGRRINIGFAETTKQARKGGSFDKLAEAADKIDEYKAKWRKSLSLKGDLDDPDRVYAAICELLYWSGLRVSSDEGKSDGQPTFGATSFQAKHVLVGGTKNSSGSVGAVTKYKAHFAVKGGKMFTLELNANDSHIPDEDRKYYKLLIQFLVAKTKGKKGNDIIMNIDTDDTAGGRINTSKLNAWIKSKGIPFTAKDFRTFRGTQVAIEVLPGATAELEKAKKANKGKPLPASEVHSIFNKAMLAVGQKLGHKRGDDFTPDTAIKNYINPSLMVDWYRQAGYQPNKKVQEAARQAGVAV